MINIHKFLVITTLLLPHNKFKIKKIDSQILKKYFKIYSYILCFSGSLEIRLLFVVAYQKVSDVLTLSSLNLESYRNS